MLNNLAGRLAFEPERSLAFGSISGVYAQIGTPFSHPIRILILQNSTNASVTFSLDGAHDTITLGTNISITLDITANKTAQNSLMLASGSSIWVKGTPGSGSVFVSAFYGIGE